MPIRISHTEIFADKHLNFIQFPGYARNFIYFCHVFRNSTATFLREKAWLRWQ